MFTEKAQASHRNKDINITAHQDTSNIKLTQLEEDVELCSNSRTDASTKVPHSNRVSHQKQQVGRIRGRTDTVEGISHSCLLKSAPLQPHYWRKKGPGITQMRQREMHCSAQQITTAKSLIGFTIPTPMRHWGEILLVTTACMVYWL